jgi:hypothetical protein
VLTKEAVTEQVAFVGALWLVPAATLTVTVTVPFFCPTLLTEIVVPFTETVATDTSLDTAEITPSPALVTAILPFGVVILSVRDVGFRLRLPAALAIDQLTVLAVVVPSDHL